MADWRRALLKQLGLPVTQQNLTFLGTWQRWEGGHTNNDASFNWLNTTHGPGRSINSVGVKAFPNFHVGITSLAETLHNGRYGDILHGLATGDPYKAAPTAGLETWVSGSPTGNPGYASKILGQGHAYHGGPPVKEPKFGSVPVSLADAGFDPHGEIAQVLFGDSDPQFASMMQNLRSMSGKHLQGLGLVDPRGDLTPIPTEQTHSVVGIAATQLGKPYVFGSGPDTKSFDCSDLIQWAYGQVGVKLPRTTFDQIHAGRGVSWKDLRPGDLIFPTTHHVVMYVGHGKVIAAPHTGTVVQYQPVSRFKNPVAIRRVGGG